MWWCESSSFIKLRKFSQDWVSYIYICKVLIILMKDFSMRYLRWTYQVNSLIIIFYVSEKFLQTIKISEFLWHKSKSTEKFPQKRIFSILANFYWTFLFFFQYWRTCAFFYWMLLDFCFKDERTILMIICEMCETNVLLLHFNILFCLITFLLWVIKLFIVIFPVDM